MWRRVVIVLGVVLFGVLLGQVFALEGPASGADGSGEQLEEPISGLEDHVKQLEKRIVELENRVEQLEYAVTPHLEFIRESAP
ncbi:MAG: hypothetical protein C4532_15220 [Candidatus Abyssobacteria bacterium SURF_17]|uniref:Uncharacterized protein n=1 Tax=Candidatus Abyssobacteria bacterium SURF_17 TaxID=2093361 RepID=A0A419ET27_9BACT|nr:MAG: hypothetical protein C4532_15220 [Candidatus Abyssubacteria bacterium SURF_17]